jgi:hypothetical protein
VLERAWDDPAGFDELINFGLLEADNPPEPIGRQAALVDEPIEAAQRDTKAIGSLFAAQPSDVSFGISRHR